MNRLGHGFSRALLALVLMTGLFSSGEGMRAENVSRTQDAPTAQLEQDVPATEPSATQITVKGIILRSGDKFVLTDPSSKTSYSLDDQLKAQDFVNKNVKVTGILDPSTGTIRVSAINPI